MQLKGERTLTEWAPPGKMPTGFTIDAVVVGPSASGAGLEVVVLGADAGAAMSREALGAYHSARVGKHTTPVVVAATRDGQAWLFGPNAKTETLGPLPAQQAERMLQAALDEASGLAARRRLADLFEAARDARPDGDGNTLPGVANAGLFATHEIRFGARLRDDWDQSVLAAAPLLGKRRQDLVEALGFTPHREAAHALLLADGVTSRAVAVLLDEAEHFDSASSRFHVSPVAYAISLAQRHELPWVLILRGSQLRLYPAQSELGVGRKGLAETYFELDLALVSDDTAGFLPLVFSSSALAPGGSTYGILAASAQYAVALGERLRGQVYDQIVPRLSLAVAEQLRLLGTELDRQGLDLAYQLTLRVFFRLLFQAYAEDRKLLPYGENPRYDRNALNTYARDFVEDPGQVFDANSTSIWDDLAQVWHVIDKGDSAWSVPAYNGGLFSADPELHPEGALLESISITNDVMGPVLCAMLLDEADGALGPVDFRSLSVREFGTIYEGLLESSLAVADTDLVLDTRDSWVPASDTDYPLDPERSALAGAVYFHNTSGQRKGTGSYFTPSFVVEHILDRALDPPLDIHLSRVRDRLDAGDHAGAADLFFDFRVADIAMGSGHFLTAAVDHLEAKMAAFLEDHPVPGIANELRALESAAKIATGPDVPEPEPSALLRRQIARRCIYGLDINPVAVELARVSIWIHTFVRGLPMSSLDHNLVCANSLTGIGSVDEAVGTLVPGSDGALTIFDQPIEDALASARAVLLEAGLLAEVDRAETQAASRAVLEAQARANNASLLFDAAVLMRTGHKDLVDTADPAALVEAAAKPAARAAIAGLRPAHAPSLFPEVLLRANGGFDVLVGNPPWEKLKVEEHQWWGLRFPGLRGMPMAQRTERIAELRDARPDLTAEFDVDVAMAASARDAVIAGPYPGVGAGDLDLYKAFAWRNWLLLRTGGSLGLVLPRAALSGSGTEEWRRTVLSSGSFRDVVVTINSGNWVFRNVDPRYGTAFVVIDRQQSDLISFGGPFHSRDEFLAGRANLAEVPVEDFLSWTKNAAFPLIPDQESANVFRTMRRNPVFSAASPWEFRGCAELHETHDAELLDTGRNGTGSIPVLSGRSFNIWNPDFGDPYALTDQRALERVLDKIKRSSRQTRSAYNGLSIASEEDLPSQAARIAFRDVCRANDSRTCIPCLIPPGVLLVGGAPYLMRRRGTERDEAYLLGVMSSIPFDWYVRRVVELHLKLYILDSIPVPVPAADDVRGQRLIRAAGRLAAIDDRFASWASAVGVEAGTCNGDREKASLEAEIDALVASLYGLGRVDVVHLFQTFHRGWDYQPRLDAVLRHFDAIGPA